MPVALVIQHAMRMRRVLLSYVACLAHPYFSTLPHKRYDFWKNVVSRKMCVLILPTTLSEKFLTLRRSQRDIIVNMYRFSCKVPVILFIFYWNLNFLNINSKGLKTSNFVDVCPLRAEVFSCGRTDRQTDMTTLIVLFAALPAQPIMLWSIISVLLSEVSIVWDAPKLNLSHKI